MNDELDLKLDKKPDGTNDLVTANGKVADSYIPDSIITGQKLQGYFTVSLPDTIPTILVLEDSGKYWIYRGADNTVIGSITWNTGDYAIWDGTALFFQLDNTGHVRSVQWLNRRCCY